MRASHLTALLAAALVAAPVAHASEMPRAARALGDLFASSGVQQHLAPDDAPPDAAGDADEPDDEDDSVDDVQADDAVGIQEDLDQGKKELEELKKAESQAIFDMDTLPRHLSRLGAANPVQERIFSSSRRSGETFERPVLTPQGDAGGMLAELSGLDLAALKAEYDIPVEINEDVVEYIRFFQGPGRKWFVHWLERSHRWIPLMRPILAEEGVPLDLVYLAMIESGFSPYAYSWAHASGFWQFMSATGKRFGLRDDFWVDERRDPLLATRSAARYLKALHDEFGDWYLAWASYNAGEGKLRKAVKVLNTHDFWQMAHSSNFLRKETKHYVPKLIAAAIITKHPERFGFTDIAPEGPFTYDEVEIPDATELQTLANAAGISVDELQQMNPTLRRWCTPPARNHMGYKIKLPAGKKGPFLAAFETISPDERLTFRHHRLVRGESLGAIARKFHTSIDGILKMNGVASARAVKAGTDLIIPMAHEIAMNVPDSGATWTEPRPSRWHRRHGHARWSSSSAVARRAPERPSRAAVKVAAGHRYVIRSGDSLWSIARRFGVEVAMLKRWNGMSGNPKLQIGRAIYVAPKNAAKAERTASYRRGRG